MTEDEMVLRAVQGKQPVANPVLDQAVNQTPATPELGMWDKFKNFATSKEGAPLIASLGAGLVGTLAGADTGQTWAGALGGGVEALNRADRLEQQDIQNKLNQERVDLTSQNYGMPKGEFAGLLALQESDRYKNDPVYAGQIDSRIDYLSRNPESAYEWSMGQEAGKGAGQLTYAGQVEGAKTLGREEAQKQVEKQAMARTSTQRINNINSLIGEIESNPDVLGAYGPYKETLSKFTGGTFGYTPEQMQQRGNLLRNVSTIQAEIIADAIEKGRSGVNTQAEVEQITKGLDENASPEMIVGALRGLAEYQQRMLEPVAGNTQQQTVSYEDYF